MAPRSRGELAGAFHGQSSDIAVACGESHWGVEIQPRLIAAGANLERVHRITIAENRGERGLLLPQDAGALAEAAGEAGIRLLVLDPVLEHVEGIDTYKSTEMRQLLRPLREGAERYGYAVLLIMHLNRARSTSIRQRSEQSIALRQVVRVQWVWGLDPDDPEGVNGPNRILAFGKLNIGRRPKSRRAMLEEVEVPTDDGAMTTIRANLGEECDWRSEDVLGAEAHHEHNDERREAARFLIDRLPSEPAERAQDAAIPGEVEAQARAKGITPTMLRKARKDLNVRAERSSRRTSARRPKRPSKPRSPPRGSGRVPDDGYCPTCDAHAPGCDGNEDWCLLAVIAASAMRRRERMTTPTPREAAPGPVGGAPLSGGTGPSVDTESESCASRGGVG